MVDHGRVIWRPREPIPCGDQVRWKVVSAAAWPLRAGYANRYSDLPVHATVLTSSRPKALAVFAGVDERLDHLGVNEVAVELIQLG